MATFQWLLTKIRPSFMDFFLGVPNLSWLAVILGFLGYFPKRIAKYLFLYSVSHCMYIYIYYVVVPHMPCLFLEALKLFLVGRLRWGRWYVQYCEAEFDHLGCMPLDHSWHHESQLASRDTPTGGGGSTGMFVTQRETGVSFGVVFLVFAVSLPVGRPCSSPTIHHAIWMQSEPLESRKPHHMWSSLKKGHVWFWQSSVEENWSSENEHHPFDGSFSERF